MLRKIHTYIRCIWGMLIIVYLNWVFLGGLALLEWVIYQAKFIPTSHYETLNLGKLLHILQKRLGIKRAEGEHHMPALYIIHRVQNLLHIMHICVGQDTFVL